MTVTLQPRNRYSPTRVGVSVGLGFNMSMSVSMRESLSVSGRQAILPANPPLPSPLSPVLLFNLHKMRSQINVI
jgi:hypothetical protein